SKIDPLFIGVLNSWEIGFGSALSIDENQIANYMGVIQVGRCWRITEELIQGSWKRCWRNSGGGNSGWTLLANSGGVNSSSRRCWRIPEEVIQGSWKRCWRIPRS